MWCGPGHLAFVIVIIGDIFAAIYSLISLNICRWWIQSLADNSSFLLTLRLSLWLIIIWVLLIVIESSMLVYDILIKSLIC